MRWRRSADGRVARMVLGLVVALALVVVGCTSDDDPAGDGGTDPAVPSDEGEAEVEPVVGGAGEGEGEPAPAQAPDVSAPETVEVDTDDAADGSEGSGDSGDDGDGSATEGGTATDGSSGSTTTTGSSDAPDVSTEP